MNQYPVKAGLTENFRRLRARGLVEHDALTFADSSTASLTLLGRELVRALSGGLPFDSAQGRPGEVEGLKLVTTALGLRASKP